MSRMKILASTLVIIGLLCLVVNVFAEAKKKFISKPTFDLMYQLKIEFLVAGMKSILPGPSFSSEKGIKSYKDIILKIDLEADLEAKYGLVSLSLASYYQKELKELLKKLDRVGSYQTYFYSDGVVNFAKFNGKTCLLISSIAIDETYNTLLTTPKERAALTLTSAVLPALHDIYDVFNNTDIEYYGVLMLYKSRNFLTASLDKHGFYIKGESVCLIASKENCRKFFNAEITDTVLSRGFRKF